jgi:ketosteroid isomerase-like protein
MAEESTTPDLVELVRESVEAVNRGDFDAMLNALLPDAVWTAAESRYHP